MTDLTISDVNLDAIAYLTDRDGDTVTASLLAHGFPVFTLKHFYLQRYKFVMRGFIESGSSREHYWVLKDFGLLAGSKKKPTFRGFPARASCIEVHRNTFMAAGADPVIVGYHYRYNPGAPGDISIIDQWVDLV